MNRVIISDALSALQAEPDESVHLIVTSPPYWGLRSYLPKDHPLKPFEIGCEATPEEYVEKLVEVFREARRVLRSDGSMWLNLSDSYNSGSSVGLGGSTLGGGQNNQAKSNRHGRPKLGHLKPKDLIGLAWMVAFALRADGWYLRSRCPWVKRNGMPESCTDRPTTTVEDLFLLTKSTDYFYDPEAVRKIGTIRAGTKGAKGSPERSAVNGVNARPAEYKVYNGTRLRRSSDWFFDSVRGLIADDDGEPLAFMVNTKPYPGAHFATFPPELIKPCILASTSEKGCCARCGKPLWRQTEQIRMPRGDAFGVKDVGDKDHGQAGRPFEEIVSSRTIGWQSDCICSAGERSCVVLDPFGGSGTVGEVCSETGRDSILIELNPDYHPLIKQRALKSPLPSREAGATVAQ